MIMKYREKMQFINVRTSRRNITKDFTLKDNLGLL